MNTRTHGPATPLLIVSVIAIAIILYGTACFPSSVTDGGLAAFIAAVVPLLVYFSVGMWARRGSARIQAALRIGTVAGLSMAAVGVLYHTVEISTSLPASIGAVLGAGMWGAMFLTFGIACSATFMKEKSIALGVLSSAWCGMIYAAVDLNVLGIIGGLGLAAILEDDVAVLEELFLPAVKESGRNAELIADGGHGDVFKQVPLEGGDLLLGGEVTTFAVHDGTSVQVRLTPTERFSRFD
jgi:hypothetical protein